LREREGSFGGLFFYQLAVTTDDPRKNPRLGVVGAGESWEKFATKNPAKLDSAGFSGET